MTLGEAVSLAIQRSPQLDRLRHETGAAAQNVVAKRSTTLPNLSSKVQFYEVLGSPVTPFSPFGVFEPGTGSVGANGFTPTYVHWGPLGMQSVDLTFPVFQYGSIMGLNDAPVVSGAKAQLTKQRLELQLAEQKVVLDVTTAYLSAIWYRDKERIEEQLTALEERKVAGIQAQASQGSRPREDLELAKIDLDGMQAALTATRGSTETAMVELSDLTGADTTAISSLDPAPPVATKLPRLRELLDEVLPSNPAFYAQEAQIEVAHQRLRATSADRFPTVSLNTSFQAAEVFDNGVSHRFNPTAFLSYLEVKIPIFDFGGRRAENSISSELYQSEAARLRELKLELRQSIAQTYGEINQIDEKLADSVAVHEKAKEKVAAASSRGTLKVTDVLVLVDAQREELTAELAIDNEKFLRGLRFAQIQNLSGGAWQWMK